MTKRCPFCRFHARKSQEVYLRCELEAGHDGRCRAGDVTFYGGYIAKKPRGSK